MFLHLWFWSDIVDAHTILIFVISITSQKMQNGEHLNEMLRVFTVFTVTVTRL